MHVHQPVAGARCTPLRTIEIDLTVNADDLFSGMRKNNKSKIRRAEREGFVASIFHQPDDEHLDRFRAAFDEFAQKKTLRSCNLTQLQKLRENGQLALSKVTAASGQTLAWHSYVRAGERVRMLQSASLFRSMESSSERNAAGRANRYLFFQDMLAFKAAGIQSFDFGGWYHGTDDPELLRINHFKEEFGGRVAVYFSCDLGLTLIGKCALVVRDVKRKLFP
jgi:lipid II:glycine glycyltransferase (peptidoglycan interpeptide bridge formation enzyme)